MKRNTEHIMHAYYFVQEKRRINQFKPMRTNIIELEENTHNLILFSDNTLLIGIKL